MHFISFTSWLKDAKLRAPLFLNLSLWYNRTLFIHSKNLLQQFKVRKGSSMNINKTLFQNHKAQGHIADSSSCFLSSCKQICVT